MINYDKPLVKALSRGSMAAGLVLTACAGVIQPIKSADTTGAQHNIVALPPTVHQTAIQKYLKGAERNERLGYVINKLGAAVKLEAEHRHDQPTGIYRTYCEPLKAPSGTACATYIYTGQKALQTDKPTFTEVSVERPDKTVAASLNIIEKQWNVVIDSHYRNETDMPTIEDAQAADHIAYDVLKAATKQLA